MFDCVLVPRDGGDDVYPLFESARDEARVVLVAYGGRDQDQGGAERGAQNLGWETEDAGN